MSCLPESDRSFGPRVNADCRPFDFTLQFEDVFLACLPAALFLFLLPSHLVLLLQKPVAFSLRSKLLASKLIALTGILTTQLAFLALRVQDQPFQTNASLAADILGFVAAGAALALSLLYHQRSLRPSTLLSLYLSVLVILDIARTRTLWLISHGSREPAVLTAILALTVIALLLESVEKKRSLRPEKKSGAPEQFSGFWNRTSFAWLAATFRLGYAKVISVDDLPLLDSQLESHKLREKLVLTWGKYRHQDRHSLLRACFRSYLPSFLSAVIPRLCLTAFTFSQPFLINTTVNFVGQTGHAPSNYGKGLIGAWLLVYLGMASSNSIYEYQNFRFTTRLRGGLIALVYERATQIRAVDSGEITAIALMGTDVERIALGLKLIHEVWGSLLDIGIAMWLLEQQLFLACIAPIFMVVASFASISKLSSAMKTAQRQWIEKIEERLRVTSNLLGDMKAVKMLGLSRVMSNIIQGLRMDEIKTSYIYRKLIVIMLLLSNTPINLAPVTTFVVYVIISVFWKNETLLTAQAFTSVAVISLLTTPMLLFIQALPSVIECIGSFDRIQQYCDYAADLETKVDPKVVNHPAGSAISLQHLTQPAQLQQKGVISFEGQSFAWDKSDLAVLKDLSVKIEPGRVTAVVGPVGSGKSSFLSSILGETVATTTAFERGKAPVAYCSQQPWLENGTIRQNIVGVSPYDRKWYSSVNFACGLDHDIRQLQKGDQTLVGSKGLNLSGGQKQRIALARAVYGRASIVLLDDVFSGMDAHTVDIVSRRLLRCEGLFQKHHTTVVIVTHSHKIMALADTIIALEEGKILEIGSPETLVKSNGYVSSLQLTLSDNDPAEEIADIADSELTSHMSADIAKETSNLFTDLRRKNGEMSVYKYYFARSGYTSVSLYVGFLILWMFCTEFPAVWLKWWSEANLNKPNTNVGMYIGVYTMLGLLGVLSASIAAWFAFITMISHSAAQLHSDLLEATLKAPFWFFGTTDNGDLANRFSEDMQLIDMTLPINMANYTSTMFSCIIKVIILVIFSKYLTAAVPFIGTVVYFLQRFYLKTSRQVRLLGIEAKAPLYTHFMESVAGAATIRAFGWQSQYQERNYRLIDTSQRPVYLQSCIQHWLGFVLDIIVTAVNVILVSTVITWRDKFSPGSVGVSLLMVMGFSTTLARLIQSWTLMESSIGAVARVKRFVAETESEESDGKGTDAPPGWPLTGALEFSGVVASHRPDTDPVLKSISMSVQPQQHIAICGRSGSGKTSLILCLLQMISMRDGQITIDGIDVSTLSSADVRSRINVVPQDPFLMPGTIRFNIDPFVAVSDDKIIRALERVRLWTMVRDQGGLDKELDTAAWSAGQRQLLCLARAMVRKSKILVLDEATSSVDSETEAVMQEIIDSDFKGCTVLAVMHRLKHIERYDTVALLDDGVLLEYGDPATLMVGTTRFAELYRSNRK